MSSIDRELQQILWACYEYWHGEKMPVSERVICREWVLSIYKERFGVSFHQSKLTKLANIGLLRKVDTTRGGHRRYYAIDDPQRVVSLLREWELL